MFATADSCSLGICISCRELQMKQCAHRYHDILRRNQLKSIKTSHTKLSQQNYLAWLWSYRHFNCRILIFEILVFWSPGHPTNDQHQPGLELEVYKLLLFLQVELEFELGLGEPYT